MPNKRKEPLKLDISVRLGQVIREQRLKKGLTTTRLAEMIGMSQAGYSKIEHGAHPTSFENAQLIADHLSIALSTLVKRAEGIALEDVEQIRGSRRSDTNRPRAKRTTDHPTTQPCNRCENTTYDVGLSTLFWCATCDDTVHRKDYRSPTKRKQLQEKKEQESCPTTPTTAGDAESPAASPSSSTADDVPGSDTASI